MRETDGGETKELPSSNSEMSTSTSTPTAKPTIKELKVILGRVQHPSQDFTEITPNIVLGGITTAKSVKTLKALGITHILNAAYDPTGKGNFIYVETNEDYFKQRKFEVKYLGTHAPDTMRFKINKFFPQVLEFMSDAVESGGKVYVHCYMGISRSASYVLCYLMSKMGMSCLEAVKFVRSKREIFPNDGFLQILLDYEDELAQQREGTGT